MAKIEETIDVQVPIRTAYDQWTQFEDFPAFMDIERLGEQSTRVSVEMQWQPEGMRQSAGAALRMDERRVEGDLERFRDLIESRGMETGAWRGKV